MLALGPNRGACSDMTCTCPDAICNPSDLCPVHGLAWVIADDNYLWLDDDRDQDDGGCSVVAFACLGFVVGLVAGALERLLKGRGHA